MDIVDLQVYKPGEIATKLARYIQEIDIIMSANGHALITNYASDFGLEKYLFKQAIDNDVVANAIKSLILANISTDLQSFDTDVTVQFLNGKHDKDIMYVNIIVTEDGNKTNLEYILS